MNYIWTLIRFSAGYFWPCVASTTIVYCLVPLSLGLASRELFDSFTGAGGIGTWTAVALIIGIQLCEVVAGYTTVRGWSGFSHKVHALLQRNMFAGILRGFGRHGLAVPTGDALSRFPGGSTGHHHSGDGRRL